MNETRPRLFAEFPPVATEEWEREIHKDLGGQDYSKRLLWHTEDGITVRPYYRREDLENIEGLHLAPGEFPYTRGASASNSWKICQEIDDIDCAAANQAAKAALAGGADEVCFRRALPKTADDMARLFSGLDAAKTYFETPDALALARVLRDAGAPAAVRFNPAWSYDDAASLMHIARPGSRPIVIPGAAIHESGGTTVQELGFTLAAGISYLNAMIERGIEINSACDDVSFSFAIGTSYFHQIAKLRAFRVLWARVVEAFGGAKDAAAAHISARTARWDKSIYDAHVNILRATTEAMSAAIGGCAALIVGAFDETYRRPDEFSRRLARNTQLILKHEAGLDRVGDPAGGSYFLEWLTDALAREAWTLMQQIEAAGGYAKAEQSGIITEQLAESRDKKEAEIASRRKIFVGTNHYPNLQERMLDRLEEIHQGRFSRGPEIFEDIRLRTERHTVSGGKTPVFLLAEMGDLKMRKARSGFAANFFGCAGFDIRTESFADAAALAAAASAIGADAVVLCSSDNEYPLLANAAIQALKGTPLIIAGFPESAIEQLRDYGVTDFIHVRSNAAETLAAWQDRLGVRG
jgi:methylmalonyl-CoA mutase